MQSVTDWLALWGELAQSQAGRWGGAHAKQAHEDVWRERARAYDTQVKAHWAAPNSSRDFIVSQLTAHPDWTALDIGGGTGSWTTLMAQYARHVTVIEPSPAMREVLRENLAAAGLSNVTIVEDAFPGAPAGLHDLTLCAHAMYGQPDFAAFIHNLEAATRRLCALIMRVPTHDGVMAQAARRVWGQPHDSPNFQVAYNALLQMGLSPDVLMENTGLWDPWSHPTLEEAYAEIKRRLNVPDESEHDAFLWDLVRRNLVFTDGQYMWPRGVRSALVHWAIENQ